MRRNQTSYQAHHLFKNAKLARNNQHTDTSEKEPQSQVIDYYSLFLALGWINIINKNASITDHENLPMAAIAYYTSRWQRRCNQLIHSQDDKIKNAAKHLVKIINTRPEKLLQIMNNVTLEYCRRQFSERHEKLIVELTIDYLARLVTDRHCLITPNDIASSKRLLDIQKEIFKLIKEHGAERRDQLNDNMIFFVSLLFPTKKLFTPVTLLIQSLARLSSNKLQRFFHCMKIQQHYKKMMEIINAPLGRTDKTQLSRALKSIIRIAKLPTYQWIKKLSTKHSEFFLMQYMRETHFLNNLVFRNANAGFWKSSDLEREFDIPSAPIDQLLPVMVPRAIGLAINAKYLYELRCLQGKEFFLKHLNDDCTHAMYFDASSFSEITRNALKQLQIMGEWKQKETNQHLRMYATSDPLSKEVKSLLSVGVLISLPVTELLTEVLVLCEMAPSEEIDLLLFVLRNEFTPQPIKYLIMYPPLLALHQASTPMTAVICPGANVWFSVYKGVIARLLLNGLNVMTFSYRGHELSDGTPTDHKLCQDLEIVCHYLIEDKRITHEQLILYASCTGLAPSAKYVYHHPETNLIIDRSFANGSEMLKFLIQDKNVFHLSNDIVKQLAAQSISRILPYFIDYENLPYLQHPNNEIALITSEKDEILEEQTEALKKSLPQAYHMTSPAMFGHAGNWLRDRKMIAQLENYLNEKNFVRRMSI